MLCPTEQIRQVFGQPGPPGPPGNDGANGGMQFDSFADLSAFTFNPSDLGRFVTVLGYYQPGDGGYSFGYIELVDSPAPVGTAVSVTDNVVTLTAAAHGLVPGDFVTITGGPVAAWNSAVTAIQVPDSNTIRYVTNAITADAVNPAVTMTITLVTAGIYRTVRPVTNGSQFIYRATTKGVVNCQWFGATGSGLTANKTINRVGINQSDEAAWGEQCEYWLPKGQAIYWIDSQLIQREGTIFRCHGHIKAAPLGVGAHDAMRVLLMCKNERTNGSYDGVGGIITKGSNLALYGDDMGILDGSATEMTSPFDTSGNPVVFLPGGGNGQGITIEGCDGVLIDSISVKDCPNFAIAAEFTKNITVRNPHVDTGNGNAIDKTTGLPGNFNGKNQDGIHFTDCTDFNVEGGDVASSDDRLAATTRFTITKTGKFHGVTCVGRMTGNQAGANNYVTLGAGVRISGESGSLFADARCDGVVVSECILKEGAYALIVRGSNRGVSASSVTRSGTTATFNSVGHGFSAGQLVNVAGALEADYNGNKVITSASANSFTFDIAVTATTPATRSDPLVAISATRVGAQQTNVIFSNNVIQDMTDPGIVTVANGAMIPKRFVEITGCDNVKVTNNQFTNCNRELYISRFTNEPATTNVTVEDNKFTNFGIMPSNAVTALSVTHVTTTATFNATAHGFAAGESVTIAGASLSQYNGTFLISTVPNANSFTYIMGSDPGADPTGTITSTSNKGVTYGAVHIISVTGPMSNIKVKGNQFKNCWLGGILVQGSAIGSSSIANLDVGPNEFDQINVYVFTYEANSGGVGAINATTGTDWTFKNNKVRNVYGAGIILSRVTGLTVSGNDMVNLGRATYKVASSVTRTLTTATFNCIAHGFTSGETVVISGAQQPEYNGTVVIASAGANSFTYVVSSLAQTPATTLTQIRATSTRVGTMTDAYGILITGVAGGPGLSNVVMNDNNVNGCDVSAYLMESVDTFDVQRCWAVNCGRSGFNQAMFGIQWRTLTSAGTYDFTNVRGIVRDCNIVTGSAVHFGFTSAIAGFSPPLASALLGVPVVFQNCDVSGPSTVPYLLTATSNASDPVPVPLPLGVIRKGAVIGGIVAQHCVLTPPADVPIPISNLGKRYRVTGIVMKNPTGDMGGSTLVADIRSAAGGVGDQLVATVGVLTLTGAGFASKIEPQTLTASANTIIRNETELYLHITTGGVFSCDLEVMGELYE